MNRAQALAILQLPREQAVSAILALGEKAERWEHLQAQGAANTIGPTTPSGMQPVYLKLPPKRRAKTPGRKAGHPGAHRPAPAHIDEFIEHTLTHCPHCDSKVGPSIRQHTRTIEEIPPVVAHVSAHTVHGHWCATCQKIVTAPVQAALPHSTLGINGVTCWLWAFATAQSCYYLIDPHRGSAVVKRVLGTLFPGILITDFWGAYNAIDTLAKQKCYFHLFTELIKVDKLTTARCWRRFRKKLARLLKDAVRLGEARHTLEPARYARRKAKLHRRLDRLIALPWKDSHARRLIKRLRRHRHDMLTFLDHEDVSPYNNHAEQQMRVAVHTRMVSQQNRSIEGAKTHAILLSHFRTANLQKLNPIDYVMQLSRSALATQTPGAAADPLPLRKAA